MLSNTTRKNDFWIWVALHISCLIAIPLAFSAMSSCIKKPELKNAALGGEVQVADIDAAIVEALSGSDPYEIKPTQAVHFLSSYRVETEEPQYYQEIIQQVKGIIDNDEEFTVVYDETIYELKKNEPAELKETKESELRFYPKPQLDVLFVPESRDLSSVGRITPDIYKIAGKTHFIPYADRAYTHQTFHNLKVKRLVKPAPAAVQARENCGDLPNCEMNVVQINFESALWYSEAEYDKVDYQWEVSNDVPYLGKFISDCSTSQQFIGERDYVIRNCTRLQDFIY